MKSLKNILNGLVLVFGLAFVFGAIEGGKRMLGGRGADVLVAAPLLGFALVALLGVTVAVTGLVVVEHSERAG